MTEAEEKAVEYLKANSLVRLNENNEVVAYGNAHKYYIINLIEKLQKENEEYKLLNANIEKANRIIEGKEEYIPKGRIRELLKKSEDTFDFIDRIVELLGGIEEPYFEEEEQ